MPSPDGRCRQCASGGSQSASAERTDRSWVVRGDERPRVDRAVHRGMQSPVGDETDRDPGHLGQRPHRTGAGGSRGRPAPARRGRRPTAPAAPASAPRPPRRRPPSGARGRPWRRPRPSARARAARHDRRRPRRTWRWCSRRTSAPRLRTPEDNQVTRPPKQRAKSARSGDENVGEDARVDRVLGLVRVAQRVGVQVHARRLVQVRERLGVGWRHVSITHVVLQPGPNPRRVLGAHAGEQVVLDVVAEVEVELVDQRQRGDAHRVLDRVVVLRSGAA